MEVYAPPLYEYGTWLPDLRFGGLKVGLTYNNRSGYYIKIGRFIMITGFFQLSNKGTSVGGARIHDLPYPNSSAVGAYFSIGLTLLQQVAYTGTPVAYLSNANQFIYMGYTAEAGPESDLLNTDFGNSAIVAITGTYLMD